MAALPYTVIYRRDPSQIRILVVKHDRRRPSYGSRRSWRRSWCRGCRLAPHAAGNQV